MKHSPQTHRVKIVAIMVVALAAVVAWGSWETQPSRTVAVSEVAAQSSAFVVSEGRGRRCRRGVGPTRSRAAAGAPLHRPLNSGRGRRRPAPSVDCTHRRRAASAPGKEPMKKVAVIVGSLRRASVNLHFAQALAKLAEGQLGFEFVDLAAVPLYNEDLWSDPPAAVPRAEAVGRRGRRRAVRDAGIQPLDAGRDQERDRLGHAPLRSQRLGRQARRAGRRQPGGDRHRGRAVAPAQRAARVRGSPCWRSPRCTSPPSRA